MYFYNLEQCFKIMYFIGGHPRIENKLQTFLYLSTAITMVAILYLQVLLPTYGEENTMMTIINTINVSNFCIRSFLAQTFLFFKKPTIYKMMEIINTEFWGQKHSHSKKARSIYGKEMDILIKKFKGYFSIYFFNITWITFGGIYRYGGITEESLPIHVYIPKNIPLLVLFIFISIGGYITMCAVISIDILVLTVVTLTKLQFTLLNDEFENIFNESHEIENANSKIRMRECNQHMTFLLSFRIEMQKMFSPVLLVYVASLIVILCLNMYVISFPYFLNYPLFSSETFEDLCRSYGYGLTCFVQFGFCYCFPLQRLLDSAENLSGSIYMSSWEKYPEHYKDMVMLLGKSQREVLITAGGLINIDYRGGIAVLKTAMSYYTFLQTVGTME